MSALDWPQSMSSSSESSSLGAGVDRIDAVERWGPDMLDGVIDMYFAFCASVSWGGLISNDGCRLGDGLVLVRGFLDGEGPSDRMPSGSGDDCGGRREGVGAAMSTCEGGAGVGVERRSWWSSICSKYSPAEGAGDGAEVDVAEEGVGGWVEVLADRGVWGRKAYGSSEGEADWGSEEPPFMVCGGAYGLAVSSV